MKRKIAFITAIVILICTLAGCGEPKLKTSGVKALNLADLEADTEYTCGSGDILYSYYEKDEKEFLGACKYYENDGYELYSYHEMADNKFATYVKGGLMAHIYWIACEGELNVVASETNGEFLPDNGKAESGDTKTTVTQLKNEEINGMGYVVQLSDGSFIIIDGGWEAVADELWDTLVDLNGSEGDIFIRAWLMTHSHNDHYSCFMTFADKYADKVTLDLFMMSPLPQLLQEGKDTYLNVDFKEDLAKFDGAEICYVYTGMRFDFLDVKMEILFTPDELYNHFVSDNYNDASVVCRIYKDDCSALFLADTGDLPAYRMIMYYGDYLKSDICQVSHHGVEDCPLSLYRYIKAPVLFFPCNTQLYKSDRAEEVRKGLINSKYTEEKYIHSIERYTVELKK